MDAAPLSQTRSGRVYSTAARVFLTPIACPPAFHITPLLRAALDRELDALPDIPMDSSDVDAGAHTDASDLLPETVCVPIPDSHPLLLPAPSLPPLPAAHYSVKRGTYTRDEATASSRPFKRPRVDEHLEHHPASAPCTPQAPATSPSEERRPAKRPRTEGRKKRKQAYKCKQASASFLKDGQAPRPKDAATHIEGNALIPVRLNAHALPVNSSGYEARTPPKQSRKKLELQDLLDEGGWTKVEWDGSDSKLLEDPATKRIWAFCVGRPADPTFDDACKDAAAILHQAGCTHEFTTKQTKHKRGVDFAAVNTGIFYGHGPPKPYNLLNTKQQDLIDEVLSSPSIKRLATFQSSSLAFYAPRLYAQYHQQHTATLEHCLWLRPNFARSVYAAAAFNFGPEVCTIPHTDCMNYAPGLCAVHGLGNNDYTKGGHLVLMEPKLIIEFPPGSLILIPSATVTHANTTIQPGEIRVSFTQYTPGALFRYVDNGFRTQERFAQEDPAGFAAMMAKKATRWKEGLELWPTFDELVERSRKGHSAA